MAVQQSENDTYEFACDVPRCGFTSSGWPLKKQATARAAAHAAEHETGEPMSELIDFEREVGFVRESTDTQEA